MISWEVGREYSTPTSQTASVKFLTQDHLGSPRGITDQNGAVVSRKDFAAFGDEVVTAQRTAGLAYQPENVRRDYTGYEKDDESGLEYAQARYYNPAHGRFTSVDPLTASASIRNPQTFNRYSYVLNSPYKFTDPLGLISSSTGAYGQCGKEEFGRGGAFNRRFIADTVIIDLNIVFDNNQMSEAGARESMKAAIEDLKATFGAINVKFNITFTPGTAERTAQNDSVCRNCSYNITSGAVDGAINVFLHDNTRNLSQSVSYFIPENRQIFIEKVGGQSIKRKLSHEVGHLFRFMVTGILPGGFPLPAFTGAGLRFVGSNNHAEDSIINSTNDRLRLGGLRFGIDYVDDFRTVSYSEITPSREANILGDFAPRRTVPRQPTPFDIYRLGARIVAAQRR